MAISEETCWEILKMAKGKDVAQSWLKGSETSEPPFQNAIPLHLIEYELVLNHNKSQIEDSLYFLQKRGYLIQHGTLGITRVVMQLSDRALQALDSGHFSKEEEQAFKEAIFDAKQAGFHGIKLNLGEIWRRIKKRKK